MNPDDAEIVSRDEQRARTEAYFHGRQEERAFCVQYLREHAALRAYCNADEPGIEAAVEALRRVADLIEAGRP